LPCEPADDQTQSIRDAEKVLGEHKAKMIVFAMDEGRKKLIDLVAGVFLVRRWAALDHQASPARENAFRDAIGNAAAATLRGGPSCRYRAWNIEINRTGSSAAGRVVGDRHSVGPSHVDCACRIWAVSSALLINVVGISLPPHCMADPRQNSRRPRSE